MRPGAGLQGAGGLAAHGLLELVWLAWLGITSSRTDVSASAHVAQQ
jgi:hypothetical protein